MMALKVAILLICIQTSASHKLRYPELVLALKVSDSLAHIFQSRMQVVLCAATHITYRLPIIYFRTLTGYRTQLLPYTNFYVEAQVYVSEY